MKKKIAFIVRGNLKNTRAFRHDVDAHFREGYEVILKFTQSAGHATAIVQELLSSGLDYLVAVGGDGTFNEVIKGYMKVDSAKRKDVILAVLPRGSGNDFVRTAGKIESLAHLHQLISSNQCKKIDIVEVTFTKNEQVFRHYYHNSFDIGLGGLASQFVNRSSKKFGSGFSYFYNIIRSFLLFKRIPLEITSPNFHFKDEVLIAVINNGKYFGNGLCITPEATMDDGKVNVFIARNVSMLHFLRYLPALKKGHKINMPEVFYGTLSECTISSPLRNCPIEMDGENIGCLPLHIKVIPRVVNII